MNQGFGKDFYRKGSSVKRFGPFTEPPDSEDWKVAVLKAHPLPENQLLGIMTTATTTWSMLKSLLLATARRQGGSSADGPSGGCLDIPYNDCQAAVATSTLGSKKALQFSANVSRTKKVAHKLLKVSPTKGYPLTQNYYLRKIILK